jgi:hypothetical protein
MGRPVHFRKSNECVLTVQDFIYRFAQKKSWPDEYFGHGPMCTAN